MDYQEQVQARLAEVRERIAEAALRSGRSSNDVQLVAVTKYLPAESELIPALLKADCFDFGESRPQLLEEKAAYYQNAVSEPSGRKIRWHQIGTLQRNKIRRILPSTALIHSIDSVKLLDAVNRIMEELWPDPAEFCCCTVPEGYRNKISVLLEVHISQDTEKQGFFPEELMEMLPVLTSFPRISCVGLMGMGGLTATVDDLHRQFESLRLLRQRIQAARPDLSMFNELSMGMSHDFELAIEHGATMVRIGSILYPAI